MTRICLNCNGKTADLNAEDGRIYYTKRCFMCNQEVRESRPK